jgi:23S rRNA pseudouridine955/2504/2580 synthase
MAAAVRHMTDRHPVNDQSVRWITVDPDSDGQRLDNFLFRLLKGVPKTHIYRVIRSGEVRRNKGRVSADARVQAGDVLRLPPMRCADKPPSPTGSAPAREFPILFEDEWLLAVDKPAATAVHGGSGVSFGVIEQLRRARPQAQCLELVHRLDRDTSGILLVAKKRSALRALQDQFRQRQTQKTYLALVKGVWPAQRKVIDLSLQKYLLPNGERRVRVVTADHPDAMRSVSLISVLGVGVLGEGTPVSLLAVTIKTGRTHQIRVHLAHAGHVIAGDDKYGDFEWNKSLAKAGHRRMFLHAWCLGFDHPHLGTAVRLHSPLPPELQDMLNGFSSEVIQKTLHGVTQSGMD